MMGLNLQIKKLQEVIGLILDENIIKRDEDLEIAEGINSAQFWPKKVEGDQITSVKQHFESVAQHFESVTKQLKQHFEWLAQHFEQHFESDLQHFEQHFMQHFESVAQHFIQHFESVAQHFYMTLKSGIYYILYVCSFLGS